MARGSHESPVAVYGAIIANFLIAVAKFTAALFTGSSAMLSEGMHSTVDTGNELLLLLGLRRSRVPPDETHPFGHGKELYFWSLIVGIVLFGIGGGASVYEGITHIEHPVEITDPIWSYGVLGFAFLAEGTSLLIAVRKLQQKRRRGEGFWKTLKGSKDPTVFMVVGEDTAAVTGVVVAFIGVYFGHRLENPYLDGIASIVIGLILITMAAFLIWESRGLLVGERADLDVVRGVRRIAEQDPAVQTVRPPLTMQLSPEELLLNLEIGFRPELDGRDIGATVGRIEERIRREYPQVSRIFIEATSLRREEQG